MTNKTVDVKEFLSELKEFALTVGEECPEKHRRDPMSGRCLPSGPTDYTEFTRSVNDDQGDEWRGLTNKSDKTFADQEVALMDAFEMDEPVSCSEGTTFSFVQRRCVSLEEADQEDAGEFAFFDEDADHSDIIALDPEGRRDTINFRCPANMLFDFSRRECIPLNKDTVMAAIENLGEEEKSRYLSGKLGITSPDPLDGHYHLVTLDEEGNGKTSVSYFYGAGQGVDSTYHSHDVAGYMVKDSKIGGAVSRHFGHVIPKEMWEYDDSTDSVSMSSSEEDAAELKTKTRNALPDSSFGVPGKRKFPLSDCNHVRNAMARFNQAKGLTPGEKSTLKSKIISAAKKCGIKVDQFAKAESEAEYLAFETEFAKDLPTKSRNALPDSSFGVPGKRKFPLHDCSHVRNAMSRFNQAKGLTAGEKATLRRKIMSKAKSCGIDVKNFAKAYTTEDFAEIRNEMFSVEDRVRTTYSQDMQKKQGPCPPGMMWDVKSKRCMKAKGFIDQVLKGSHSDIIALDPAGRKDTVNFQCPPNQIFDFSRRECIPLNKDTVMSSEENSVSNTIVPNPKGRPAKLPQDCPKGTIWDKDLEKCKPLDSRQKTKSEDENAQTNSNGPGKNKDSKGCAPGEFFNPITKKCMPVPGKFKKKSKSSENAGREGLTTEVPGKVKIPQDCPPNTIWDGSRRTCTPMSTMDKNKPSGGTMNPKNTASDVEKMSIAQLIQHLDEIIRVNAGVVKETAQVAAKDLPNEAFPPSLVRSSKRSLLHHTPEVTDPYDNATVNVSRLRNALARVDSLSDYSEQALYDAKAHLVFHAREVVKSYLGKN